MTGTEMFRECSRDAELDVVDENVKHAMQLARETVNHGPRDRVVGRLAGLLKSLELPRTVTTTCPFAGMAVVHAEGQMGSTVKLTWQCPVCGSDHEEVD